jgi:hypothetical protein
MDIQKENKIDCSKVFVKQSSFSNAETGDFDGAFAAVAFKEGELCRRCRFHAPDSRTHGVFFNVASSIHAPLRVMKID